MRQRTLRGVKRFGEIVFGIGSIIAFLAACLPPLINPDWNLVTYLLIGMFLAGIGIFIFVPAWWYDVRGDIFKPEEKKLLKKAIEEAIKEERRRIVQPLRWALFFLTCVLGLIGLYQYLIIHDGIFFWILTVLLCLVYLGFAWGMGYSLARISLGAALQLYWRKRISEKISEETFREKLDLPSWYKKIHFHPWYERILFDKEGNFKKWAIDVIRISRYIIFLFWLVIMLGKLITPP